MKKQKNSELTLALSRGSWLRRVVGSALALAALVESAYVAAAPPKKKQEPECAEDDPTACALPLEKGDKAPFSGQLLTPPLAIKLGQEAAHCPERVALEVARTSSIAKIDLRYEKELRSIDVRELSKDFVAMTKDRDYWREQATKGPSWYEHPVFVAVVTAAVALGAVAVAASLDGNDTVRWLW